MSNNKKIEFKDFLTKTISILFFLKIENVLFDLFSVSLLFIDCLDHLFSFVHSFYLVLGCVIIC